MDYMALAIAIVTKVLVPSLTTLGSRALEEAGKKTGAEVFDRREQIVERVKALFARDELTTLGLLAEHPDDARTQGRVEGQLQTKLEANPDAAKEIEDLLTSFSLTQGDALTQTGDNNNAIMNSPNSSITSNR